MPANQSLQTVIANIDHSVNIEHFFDFWGRSPGDSRHQWQVLTEDGGHTIAGLVDYGDAGGQVLALADVGIFVSAGGTPQNLTFWRNLVRYARSR